MRERDIKRERDRDRERNKRREIQRENEQEVLPRTKVLGLTSNSFKAAANCPCFLRASSSVDVDVSKLRM